MSKQKRSKPKTEIKLKIDRKLAAKILREESALTSKSVDKKWVKKFHEFSKLCVESDAKTHVAFLGTTLLAKSVNKNVDLYEIKPAHSKKTASSYSARTLCHGVLVPLAAELGIDLGVTGREPLNNQPYFRMRRLGDGTPVHKKGKAAFVYMLGLVKEISALKNESAARVALRAFIFVRKQFQRKYSTNNSEFLVGASELTSLISQLTKDNAEGGKLAQATVAGLIDIFAGTDRVDCGRINDPSRKYPGDVCVRSSKDSKVIEKAFEVRDKPVSLSDVQIFGKKCADMGAKEASVVMVSKSQQNLDHAGLNKWAESLGIGMTLFYGWSEFVDQVLFWADLPKVDAATEAASRIETRLIETEASTKSVSLWQSLTRKK